jgi:hypothetical protein
VVDQPVGDAGLFGDIADTGGLIALGGEDADGCGKDQLSLVLGCRHGATPYSWGRRRTRMIHTFLNRTIPTKGGLEPALRSDAVISSLFRFSQETCAEPCDRRPHA